MIKNDKQLEITIKQVEKFEDAITKLDSQKESMAEIIYTLQRNALKGQLETLIYEIKEYESLKKGNLFISNNITLENIGEVFLKARISIDMSQAELAKRIGTTQQQIQRYESSNYETAGISKLLEISAALGISLRFERICFFRQSFDFPDDLSPETISSEQKKLREKGQLFTF